MADNTYLAVFLGNRNSPRAQAFFALPEDQRNAKQREGGAAWHAWMEKHKDVIAYDGGPLGKTKKVGPDGISDVSNDMGGFCVITAPSADAAAKLFEKHPHFTIFPGERVEVMPVMPVPQAS